MSEFGQQKWIPFPSRVQNSKMTDSVQNNSHVYQYLLLYRCTKSWNGARTLTTGMISLLLWKMNCINCANWKNKARMKQVLHSIIFLMEHWSVFCSYVQIFIIIFPSAFTPSLLSLWSSKNLSLLYD